MIVDLINITVFRAKRHSIRAGRMVVVCIPLHESREAMCAA
jgi:hypothetical protein